MGLVDFLLHLCLLTVMVRSNAIWHSRSWQFSNSQLPRHTETRDYSAENANYVGWVSNTPHVYLAFSKAFEVISKIENYTEDRTIRRYYYNLKFYLPFDAADTIKWGTRLVLAFSCFLRYLALIWIIVLFSCLCLRPTNICCTLFSKKEN